MVDYLAFFDDQHGNSTMAPPPRFWHGATRGLNPALDVAVDVAVRMPSTLRPKKVTKSCTIWVEAEVDGSAGGNSMLLTLDKYLAIPRKRYKIDAYFLLKLYRN